MAAFSPVAAVLCLVIQFAYLIFEDPVSGSSCLTLTTLLFQWFLTTSAGRNSINTNSRFNRFISCRRDPLEVMATQAAGISEETWTFV